MSQLNSSSPDQVEFKFQLPDETLDSRLVSVECDDDIVVMMSEFEPSQRIPLYIFDNAADLLTRLGVYIIILWLMRNLWMRYFFKLLVE